MSLRGTVASVSRNDAYSFTKPVRDEIVLVAGIGVEGDVHAGVNVRHRHRVKLDPTQPNLRQVHLIHEELFGEVGEKGYAVNPGNLGENVTTSGLDLLGLPLGTILRFGPPARDSEAASGSPARGVVAESGSPAPGAVRESGSAAPGAVGESGSAALAGVLAAAAAARLDEATAAAAEQVAAVAARAGGDDPRPAVIVAGLRNPCAQINKFRPGLLREVIGQDEQGNVVRKGGVMGVVLRGGPIRPGDEISVELPPPPLAPLEKI
ncbi:MOSC domain-containing protein [Actinoplanes sp. NPDC049596]|uniref:MOSC domain-containing protein n=1 Tax=unclassified Actinoplanes TaxID=2626549 RepID=UPI00343660DB